MACGVSICPNLYFANNDEYISNTAFIVCDYWPSFRNYTTRVENLFPPYNSGNNANNSNTSSVVCSECPTDRMQCGNNEISYENNDNIYIIDSDDINSLCYGCPEPDYYFCQSRTACSR